MDSKVMGNSGLSHHSKRKVNQLTLRNLTPAQKEAIIASGTGLAGVMAGAGVYSLIGFASGENAETPLTPPGNTETTETCLIYTNAPMADTVHDGMSFKQAFEAAREDVDGGGGFFEWHGQVYSTYTENEWNAMGPDDRQAFSNSLHNNPDFELPEVPEMVAPDNHADPVAVQNHDEPTVTVPVVVNDTPQAADQTNTPDVVNDTPQAAAQGNAPDEAYALDMNDDGTTDSLGFDVDGDGYIDIVAIDTNVDTVPDMYLLDSDDATGLDMVIIDAEQDGIDGTEPAEILTEDQVIILSVEEIEAGAEPQPASTNDDADFTIQEDMPDLDDNADVSDFT